MGNNNLRIKERQTAHLVDPSPWPLQMSVILGITILGTIILNKMSKGIIGGPGEYSQGNLVIYSLIGVILIFILWLRDILRESVYIGKHTIKVKEGIMIGPNILENRDTYNLLQSSDYFRLLHNNFIRANNPKPLVIYNSFPGLDLFLKNLKLKKTATNMLVGGGTLGGVWLWWLELKKKELFYHLELNEKIKMENLKNLLDQENKTLDKAVQIVNNLKDVIDIHKDPQLHELYLKSIARVKTGFENTNLIAEQIKEILETNTGIDKIRSVYEDFYSFIYSLTGLELLSMSMIISIISIIYVIISNKIGSHIEKYIIKNEEKIKNKHLLYFMKKRLDIMNLNKKINKYFLYYHIANIIIIIVSVILLNLYY